MTHTHVGRLAALVVAVLLASISFSAQAVPVTIAYTADNITSLYGECTVADCSGGIAYAPGPNAGGAPVSAGRNLRRFSSVCRLTPLGWCAS